MPHNSNFRLHPSHRFFAKNRNNGYGAKSRLAPSRVRLRANGVPLDKKKMGQNHKKLPCPKIRIFDYPAVINFSQKMEITVMVPNQAGDPLGSILGPIGSHWVQKLGQNLTKLPCAKSRWGPPSVHLGANGVPLGTKKWVKTVTIYHAPKSNFLSPRGHRLF